MLNEKLMALRKTKNLSQEELADHIGVSRQAVAKWESGISIPDLDHLIAVSRFFGISLDKLLKDEEESCSNSSDSVKVNMGWSETIGFLCRAKKATYAGKGGEVAASRTGSHDLSYSEADLSYYDTYIGGERFAGEEAVWRDSTPIWAMNYVGRVLGEGFSSDFLKEVLSLVPKDYPFRGPLVYAKGDFRYHMIMTGDFEWFEGYEEIFCEDRKVYDCRFHGGLIV